MFVTKHYYLFCTERGSATVWDRGSDGGIILYLNYIIILNNFIKFVFNKKEKLRKKKVEEEEQWTDYMEQRKKARAKEEEELRKLKDRQVFQH